MAGVLSGRHQKLVVSALSLTTLATAAGLCDLAVGDPRGPGVRRAAPRRAGPRRGADRDVRGRGLHPDVVARPGRRPAGRRSSARRLPGAAPGVGARHDAARAGAEPDRVLRRARAALGAALRAVRVGDPPRDLARVGPQVPDRRLARIGDAALRAVVHLRRGGIDRLQPDRPGDLQRQRERLPRPHGGGADRDGARVQDLDRALPPVDARRLPGRPHADHGVHGGGDEGGGVRRPGPHVRRPARLDRRRLAAGPLGARRSSRSRSGTSARSARTR